ncbi:MAG: hypothetical protein R3B84_03760 [Zavarzinella sp.]
MSFVRLHLDAFEAKDLPSSGLASFDDLQVNTSQYSEDQILVKFEDNQTVAHRWVQSWEHLGNGLYLGDLRSGVDAETAVATLAQIPQIEFAQLDYVVQINRTPNDTNTALEWDPITLVRMVAPAMQISVPIRPGISALVPATRSLP